MSTDNTAKDSAIENGPVGGGGMPALEGYLYQIDISVLAALDTLIVKKMADRLVLEPADQDDLEADLKDPASASAATDVAASDYRIVVQAKYRGTIWKPGSFADLLRHGKTRPSALKRLEDPQTRYLLITTGAVDTGIQELLVKNIGEWPRKAPSNKAVANLLPDGAHRRVAILNWNEEVLRYKLEEYLERYFRVPRGRVGDCLSRLRDEALDRMRGAHGGLWTRREIQDLISQHQGYFASATEIELFVPPGNWKALVEQIKGKYAVIVIGPSGTGKTTTATVLADRLQRKYPGTEIKHIINGPGEIATDRPAGPVIYLVDDPWGKYRVGPNSEPWNDEISRLLSTASASRYFIVTSRSDVFKTSNAKVDPSWFVELDTDDYEPRRRLTILEKRLQKLPRTLQELVYPQKYDVTNELKLPLEIAKYVQLISDGPRDKESDSDFLRRALNSAKNETIESIVAQQVNEQNVHPWAAVVWGVFKAGANVERAVFSELQSLIAELDQSLDDGLERFVTFLENGHSLRQNERLVSYYHPRVEAGLQAAIVDKSARTRRVLALLADALITMHTESGNDWGADACAFLVQAARDVEELAGIKLRTNTAVALDTFLTDKLLKTERNYAGFLRLAASAMSLNNDIGKLCRWLVARKKASRSLGFNGFPPTWDSAPMDSEVVQRLSRNEVVRQILRQFVEHALPYDAEIYPSDTWKHLLPLDQNISDAFVAAAADSYSAGVSWHVDAIASGASQDLDSFWPVVQTCLDYKIELAQQPDDGTSLSIYNREYSDDYAEHLSDVGSEEGYSAGEFIETYVRRLREVRGWEELRDHPRIAEMGYAWMRVARDASTITDLEILHLAALSEDTSWEDELWRFAEKHWIAQLAGPLLRRASADVGSHRTRAAILETGLRSVPEGVKLLAEALAEGGDRRVLIALNDLRTIDDADLIEPVNMLREALIASTPAAVSEVSVALTPGNEANVLSAAGTGLVSGLSRPDYPAWQLRRAKLLAASGFNVAALVDDLLTTEEDWLSNTIPAAAGAVELAEAQGLAAIVDSALTHKYADVRQKAMLLIASRSQGPLPPEILALSDDKGSGVKLALLDLIESRPGQYALGVLVKLAGDQWSSSSRYYGQGASFDIGQKAGDLLAVVADLSDAECETLVSIATDTDDEYLAEKLFFTVLQRGKMPGERRVLEFALTRGKVPPRRAALNALARRDQVLSMDLLDRANEREIATRAPEPAALLAYLVGKHAREERALAIATEVSLLPARSAMLFPLWVGAVTRSSELPAKIAALFPGDIMTTLRAIDAAGGLLPRDFFNSMGDPEAVDGILRAFPECFIKKPKA